MNGSKNVAPAGNVVKPKPKPNTNKQTECVIHLHHLYPWAKRVYASKLKPPIPMEKVERNILNILKLPVCMHIVKVCTNGTHPSSKFPMNNHSPGVHTNDRMLEIKKANQIRSSVNWNKDWDRFTLKHKGRPKREHILDFIHVMKDAYKIP